jgi:L-fucose isomerase-like protein
MGLVSSLLLWPLAPVMGVISLAELIQRRVDEELYSPASTRRQLEELEDARRRGEITAEQERQGQERILRTRMGSNAGDRTPNKDR